MVGKKRKGRSEVLDVPIDLASRIGGPGPSRPEPAAPEAIRRVDGPIESDRARGRPAMIGANEAPGRPVMIGANEVPVRPTMPEPERVASSGRPTMIGLEEAFAVPASITSPAPAFEPSAGALMSTREAPLTGEMDLVVTPLATPDDWHHFELALRRVPGVGALRIEYYRAGILKLRLGWSGQDRFAHAVAGVPGYRVGILGEDRSTVQIRVARA
jgi:hypothetical protein